MSYNTTPAFLGVRPVPVVCDNRLDLTPGTCPIDGNILWSSADGKTWTTERLPHHTITDIPGGYVVRYDGSVTAIERRGFKEAQKYAVAEDALIAKITERLAR